MNPLPYDRQQWAFARILTAPSFNLGVGPWTIQPMWSKKRRGDGFEFLQCTRACLPAIGEATFQYRFGLINGDAVGIQSDAGVTRRLSGEPWDTSQDAATAPNLRGYEVRIQLAKPVAQGETPQWRTEWWGTVEYQEDRMWPGAAYPAGVRTYRCFDGFARAKRWPLDRHSVTISPDYFIDVEGHPGYNVTNSTGGLVIGNKSNDALSSAPTAQVQNPAIQEIIAEGDTGYGLHTYQGSQDASAWTVRQALEDAVRKRRGKGEPLFSFFGSTDLLGETLAIPVQEGDNAWDLVARTCRRERGRGVVFCDWADDTAVPAGPLDVRLTIRPQTLDDITYTNPAAGGSGTIQGATTAGTTTTVDLIGDHRVDADNTELGDRYLHVADAVETIGENIQALVTLSYFDSPATAEKRWLASREATFAALTRTARREEAWAPMWNLHGLKASWLGPMGDHNGGTTYYADYNCTDLGAIGTSLPSGHNNTSPILCRIMPDLPMYEGYDYSSASIKRKIGSQASLDEAGQPSRRSPFAMVRIASDKYLNTSDIRRPMTIQIRGRDILVWSHAEVDSLGYRIISDTSTASLAASYNLSALGITVGLELPHKVRRRTVRTGVADDQIRRTVIIRLPDMHLWLAHSGAIWDLDKSTGSKATGFAGKRGAAGGSAGSPGILRDDRDALSRIHSMACAWYLESRQTAKWTLRACGMLPSFDVIADPDESSTDTTTVNYPTLGQLVTDFKAAGQITTLNTPITSVTYSHANGTTIWETDWQEFDYT